MDQIQLFFEGERQFLEVPSGTPVENLQQAARFLKGELKNIRVNGAPAAKGQVLKNGDKVSAVPDAGILG